MPLTYFDASGTATAAGIFIPRDNIAGLTANAELAPSEPEIAKKCKFLAGFLASFQSAIALNRANPNSLSTALGFTITKSNPSGVGQGIFNQTFTASIAQVIDYSTGTFYPIPVPTTGTKTGLGVLKITDVFPDAVSVANAGAIAEAGILISHSELDTYGAVLATDPSNDTQSRQWFAAMIRYLFDEIPIRVATTTPSALTIKTLGDIAEFGLPDDAFTSPNPSTDLSEASVTVNDVYVRPISFVIQYLLNEQTQTFDVRIV